jgi:RHS repeat-associated protein
VNANTTLTYDLADRLLTTVLPGPGNTTTAFTLDALGRIATRTPPGGSAEPFSYLGTSETVTAIGGVTPVSAGLDPAGARLAAQSGATTGFLLADLHANLAAATTSGETALLAAVRYDPYGGTAASWDSGAGFPMPWRFQSRLDLMSNPTDPLYEWSARYYLPAVGAFSQLDAYAGQVGDPRSLHRYLYAAANPWTLIDPSGHAFISGPEAEDSQKAVYTSDGQLHWIDRGPGPAPGQTTPSSLSTPPLSAKVRNPKSEPDPILFVGSTVLNLARLFGSDVACLSTYLTPISAIGCDDIMALAGREDSGIDPLNFIYENHGPLVGDDPVAKGEAFANVLYVASLGAGGVSLLRGLARVRFLQPNQVLDPIGEALGPRPPGPYQRPPGATTAAQRDAVQGQPCVVCGVTTPRQVADHTYALVREWYETGTIDLQRARSVEAVQAMCPGCSAAEGGFLSWYSRAMKDIFGFD